MIYIYDFPRYRDLVVFNCAKNCLMFKRQLCYACEIGGDLPRQAGRDIASKNLCPGDVKHG